MAWGSRITNGLKEPTTFEGYELLPGETLLIGPRGSAKILSSDRKTKAILGTKLRGEDMGIWGFATLTLGLVGVLVSLIAVRLPTKSVNRVLGTSTTALLLIAAFVACEALPILRANKRITPVVEWFAPFGEWRFCTGIILVFLGAITAVVSATILFRGRTGDSIEHT